MKKIIPAIAFIFVLALLSASCLTEGERYSRFHTMTDARWLYGDTLVFDFQEPFAADSGISAIDGDVVVVLRHSRSYPYSNIWLELGDKNGRRRDTLNVILADIYGHRLGKGLGTDFQRADTVARGLRLDSTASLTLRHIMRVDTLGSIEQIGMIFIPRKIHRK